MEHIDIQAEMERMSEVLTDEQMTLIVWIVETLEALEAKVEQQERERRQWLERN